jgi:predicted Zn-dependent protease
MTVARSLQISVFAILLFVLAGVQFTNLFLIANRALPSAPISWIAPARSVWAQHVAEKIAQRMPGLGEQQFLAAVALDSLQQAPTASAISQAQQRIDALPLSPTRDADEAQLAFMRGDNEHALQYGIRAHAVQTVETTLDRVEQQGDIALSLREDKAWIAVLEQRATDREALAAAWWRDGRLENLLAQNLRKSPERQVHQRAALSAFRAEVALTPLSGLALLNAGYAALAIEASAEAQHYFAAAVASDPASASGYVGIARVAILQHTIALAQQAYAHAHLLAPQQNDVLQLGRDLSIQ